MGYWSELLGSNIKAMEILAVKEGIKPCARIMASEDSLPSLKKELDGIGLACSFSGFKVIKDHVSRIAAGAEGRAGAEVGTSSDSAAGRASSDSAAGRASSDSAAGRASSDSAEIVQQGEQVQIVQQGEQVQMVRQVQQLHHIILIQAQPYLLMRRSMAIFLFT
ncbi:hypothetical protein HYU13_04115 [Candidatus Woesearchaeota archaeon]|nr:hypothetical protein [Candidatus Woesearchaeota archaeon]